MFKNFSNFSKKFFAAVLIAVLACSVSYAAPKRAKRLPPRRHHNYTQETHSLFKDFKDFKAFLMSK